MSELIAIPAHVHRTLVSCLRARAQMAQMFADLPLAQRHIVEVEMAMEWLAEQEAEQVEGQASAPEPEYVGPVVHDGQRWPAYGTHKKEYIWRRR